VFTDYVRSLAAGEPVNRRRLEEVWDALRFALRGELKKRGLWEAPPSYLGVYGSLSWEAAGAASQKECALEELLSECYAYNFVDRLRSLQAQLKVKPNIDGLVFLNIRHFLHERQKEHDPLGSQVFEVLQSAVRLAVEEGDLRVIEGDAGVRNDTVLGFGGGARSSSLREKAPALVARWNDELLPDLVTLRGQRQETVVRRLRERLSDLRREGIEAFRFKDLVDPLKNDVRGRWAAILERSQCELAPQVDEEGSREAVPLARPDTGFEERQVFLKLVDCVLTSIRKLDTSEKTRSYLVTLWQFLRLQASEDLEEGMAAWNGLISAEEPESGGGGQPSLRRLAEQLRIPRDRLPELYHTLGKLLEECRGAISGRAALKSLKEKGPVRRGPTHDH
jgi:hypothetical protein